MRSLGQQIITVLVTLGAVCLVLFSPFAILGSLTSSDPSGVVATIVIYILAMVFYIFMAKRLIALKNFSVIEWVFGGVLSLIVLYYSSFFLGFSRLIA
jgi:hypothetical protein